MRTLEENVYCMGAIPDLEDQDNQMITLPADHPLRIFVEDAPRRIVHSDKVTQIEAGTFDQRTEELERKMRQVLADNDRLKTLFEERKHKANDNSRAARRARRRGYEPGTKGGYDAKYVTNRLVSTAWGMTGAAGCVIM